MFIYSMLIDEEQDVALFEDIYQRYRLQMYDVAISVLRDPQDTEDALQIAFLGIARQIKKMRTNSERATRAYALTAAKNAATSILRKKLQEPKILQYDDAIENPHNEDMVDQIVMHDDYQLLFKVLSAMPLAHRELLMLRHVQGFGNKEIAEITNRNPDRVRVQLHRARQELIKRCREEGMCYVCAEETDPV